MRNKPSKKMRTNSNRKVHKHTRDPFQSLIRASVFLVIFVVCGIGVFYLCSLAVENDFIVKRDAMDQYNEEAEIEFNANLSAQLNQQNAVVDTQIETGSTAELLTWESTLDETIWSIQDDSNRGLENTSTVSLDRNALLQGGLMLINAWHPLPSEFTANNLISIGTESNFTIQVTDSTVKVFPQAYVALENILRDASNEGHEYYLVREGYRSYEDQAALFQGVMDDLSSDYSGDILIEQTKKDVNYPGTSDYQSGMSFRMDLYKQGDASYSSKYQQSEQGKWFTENCWKYGIIFRFPTKDFPTSQWEDKSYKTGVSVPLNLYRYTGVAHSTAMKIMGYCLEEYVEFLIDHPHISIYENGALRYEIVRINANETDASFSLPVPNPASDYQASFDNMGGIVMAYTYN